MSFPNYRSDTGGQSTGSVSPRPTIYTARLDFPCMENVLASVAVVVVVGLFASALYWMTVGDYTAAGLSFLSASIVIYYRENRLVAN